ncbi:MAG TPA: hypothetical protein PKW66_23605, partial [Polyangiaceae bacterium]|nr:hypothetical protein [Polyangiaceae bacterium]
HRGLRHILFAVCDHYEPLWNQPTEQVGERRVAAWQHGYPKLAAEFRDADGRPPQHTFFFPGEEYRPFFFDRLEPLIEGGFGEVELHLHHDDATAESFRHDVLSYLDTYAKRGHLSRSADGRVRYGFIHGNWALANGRPDGRRCGVDNELPLLFETGCYADFTFPSAPDITQPNIVNRIYWPVGDPSRKRAYEWGERARVGHRYHDRILLVQGPLALVRRPGSLRIRIEASSLTAKDPGTPARIRSWLDQHIHVQGRPEWVFVKVHTHGAPEHQAESLLGKGGYEMHRELNARYNDGVRYSLHYVTAREMVNIAWAAMDGKTGNPNAYRDYELAPPPLVRRA